MSSQSTSLLSDHQDEEDNLPLKSIPGTYGWPFFGPVRDRLDYFYRQGDLGYCRAKMAKHQSTVFRANIPPGPFVSSNSRAVFLLDAVSFPALFDTERVEKRDVLAGTYAPGLSYTGGYRVCSYLDPSEPEHATLKCWVMSVLAARHGKFIPLFQNSVGAFFKALEEKVAGEGRASLNDLMSPTVFDFVFKLLCDGKGASETELGQKGAASVASWLLPQLAPMIILGLRYLPNPVEDLILHTFPLPYFLIKSDYEKLYKAFYNSASTVLDEAERMGISREEACHNIVPQRPRGHDGLVPEHDEVDRGAGEQLHRRIRDEIRPIVKQSGGLTLSALDKMSLTKSVVYEALRIQPGVPLQYAKAKEDMIIRSHDAKFLVKKGEMLVGDQRLATRDPKVFRDPEEFIGDRFLGAEGEKLLKYIYWSNGRETDAATADNKACPGKDMIVLLSRVLLAEFFLRYDTFTVESSNLLRRITVTFTSLTKATS
uniref:Allene oxide synthase n=1 Tax=Kalanchoe fedtschenkoi TaxID=63787 RepID=A0A7N0ZRV0_KALFE